MPPETLTQFITRRLAELEEEEQKLRDRISEISFEKHNLYAAADRAKYVYLRQNEGAIRVIKDIRPGSIMESVVKILSDFPDGLIALDILRIINATRTPPLERTSLSPQLSRLRQRGILELVGSAWRLVDKEKPSTD